jgi:hypothetical protein
MTAPRPCGILRALFPALTATGAPRTLIGYHLGRLLCRLGRHRRWSYTAWAYWGRGDQVVEWCQRDRCEWGLEWWTGEGRPRGRTARRGVAW